MSKLKKSMMLATASALTASMCSAIPFVSAVDSAEDGKYTKMPYVRECEDPEIANGNEIWTSIYQDEIPGYSGEGFVYLNSNSMKTTITVPEDGMYEISVRYAQFLSEEGREQTIKVNGRETRVNFPYSREWSDISFGIFRFNKGENEIEITPQYGYASYDTITIKKAEPHDYTKATDELVDAKATDETKALMKYLKSVYGSHIISGQQEIYGGGNDGNSELEFEYIQEKTGKQPAIRGFDFMNYNPLYGWEDGTTERAIAWVKEKKGIITASWHINVPIDFDNYELGDEVDWKQCSYKNYQASNSTFNTAKVLEKDSKERAYFEAAMEDLAEQLKLLQDENVPIIFRPLHEAQGNEGHYGDGTAWFWWGDRGPEVYKELWKLLYTTLTEKYELHNIIWEFNSYNYSNSDTWYPGDEYVDILAYDKYNVDNNRDDGLTSGPNVSAISSIFDYIYKLTDGKKMVAMAENDTVPTVENMVVENANWLYFCPWYGEHLMDARYQDAKTLSGIYNSDYCITLDELPEDLYVLKADTTKSTDVTESTTTAVVPTGTVTNKTIYGDANNDGTVDVADVVASAAYVGNPEGNKLDAQGLINADVHNVGNGITADDALAIQQYLAKIVKELPVK
ncbi:MAG: beta-mannosidase [Oscillospiraceae bacterium]|nr:beta-mannosidase [Oscillospiraceae bacterium]